LHNSQTQVTARRTVRANLDIIQNGKTSIMHKLWKRLPRKPYYCAGASRKSIREGPRPIQVVDKQSSVEGKRNQPLVAGLNAGEKARDDAVIGRYATPIQRTSLQ
jgi:hypothetical protein